jgi:hypothetical protein
MISTASKVLAASHYDRPGREVSLVTGDLKVTVDRCDLPLDELCGFAARQNPKRGFLFVSKVLGKHIPVKPSVMRDVQRRLAVKIPADLPGPVVVIGMAETAICLGHGVYEEYLRLSDRRDVLFIHSTRYRLNAPAALEFLEEHSHAADHIIYLPEAEADRCLFRSARSLVLVDDEASTGKTFVNLAKAFKLQVPNLQAVVTAVLTDWRGEERAAATAKAMPAPSKSLAILEGGYTFAPAPGLAMVALPKVVGNGEAKDSLLSRNYGRLGLRGRLATPSISHGASGRCLVLGTGEFSYPPFLLAEQMEKNGVDALYQSTTRSPIMLGGAIRTSLTFRDNYADGIPNFLYNASRADYDRVVVCHETPAATLDSSLLSALEAESQEF